jgi:pyrroloquinoline quinone biosynthesis protein E
VSAECIDGTANPCMGGRGALSLTVAPDGTVLPCPAVGALPGLDAPHVTQRRHAWIWQEPKVFNAYGGQAWMRDPSRTCALRTTGFGGCRCPAYALPGEADRADPVCRHSPGHHLVRDLVDEADGPRTELAYAYRAY